MTKRTFMVQIQIYEVKDIDDAATMTQVVAGGTSAFDITPDPNATMCVSLPFNEALDALRKRGVNSLLDHLEIKR